MELEPLITAGAAVAFSVAGYFMSNQRSKQKANLRAIRSESDLGRMRANAMLPESSGDAMKAASAFDNSEGSKPVVPTNSPRGFMRGLNIVGTDEAHSNVLQRICITPPSLPPLLEAPEEQNEVEEKEINKESESDTKIEIEKDDNLDKEKEIKCDQELTDELFKREEETISNEPDSLFSAKVRQPQKEPETKFEQEESSVEVKNQAIEWPHKSVGDLLWEEDSEDEEEIKYVNSLPQTLLDTKEENVPMFQPFNKQPKNYAAPKVKLDNIDELEKEKEIEELRALTDKLLDREQSLQFQLLEYYGLKEQVEAVKEMEDALKKNSTEAKSLSHKVESLQQENEMLRNKIMELEKVTEKLDRNKEKIEKLKNRLRSEDDNTQEQITLLRESIGTLTDKENKSAADYAEIENKLERVKELEKEVNELKKLNSRLEEEKSGLAHRLENVQYIASKTMKSPEEQVLEEATRLREKNEKLEQEIAQLRDDHSLSVEEVVYLRWLNACLRHELTHPSKGKGIASELNKSPSYHSIEKLKELVQEYANMGINIDEAKLLDLDLYYSSSMTPSMTPSTLISSKPEQGRQSKHKSHNIIGKFKKFVMGKSNSNTNKDKDKDRISQFASESASVAYSGGSSPSSSITTLERSPQPEKLPRGSLNIARPSRIEPESLRSNSDLGLRDRRGEPRRYHALHFGESSVTDDREVEEMKKLALALKCSKLASEN